MGWLPRVTNEPGASSSSTRFDASLDLRQKLALRDGRRPLLMLKTLLADTDLRAACEDLQGGLRNSGWKSGICFGFTVLLCRNGS